MAFVAPSRHYRHLGIKNAIRPTALGKKNWLFIGEAEAGERSAILYTIVECCRRRGIDPYAYLRDILTRLPSATNWQITDLTPKPGRDKLSPSRKRPEAQLHFNIFEDAINPGKIERLGINRAVGPVEKMAVILMLRVGQRLQHVIVAVQTAGVLQRTGIFARQAKSRLEFRIGGQHLLQSQTVVPTVAKVILVNQLLPGTLQQISQSELALIVRPVLGHGERHVIEPRERNLIGVFACMERMQMRIGPAHDHLHHIVQSRKPDR